MTYGDPNFGGKAPYYEDWSFNIQHSFTPNLVLSVAYSGSAGHWLPGAGGRRAHHQPDSDAIPSAGISAELDLERPHLAQAQALFPNIAIPFPNFTGTIGQALKPFPQYSGISDPWLDVGNSTYNALQISLNQRFSHGLTFMLNYTFSKELDDLVGRARSHQGFPGKRTGRHRSPQCGQRDLRLPVALRRGSQTEQQIKVLNAVISHWQVSGIFTYTSGAPLSITGTCTGGGIIDASCYPNYTPASSGSVWQNGSIGSGGANVTTTSYLNKTAFVDPLAYTAGNIARSAPFGLFAPHNADLDVSVRREFPIREQVRLAFQADAFNVNNAVHFAAPGTGIDSASFGIFSSMAN